MKRLPPYDAEAERAVIGGIVRDSRWFFEVSSIVSVDDFYSQSHREIYRAVSALVESGVRAVDAALIHEKMTELGTVKQIGDLVELTTMADNCLASASPIHAATVRDYAKRRALMLAGARIQEDGYDLSVPVDDYASLSRKAIVEIADNKPDDRCLPVADTIDTTISRVSTGESMEGMVLTGWPSVDEKFAGIAPRVMTVLAGRPAMGKSSAVLNIAINAAMSGRHVLLISLEDARYYIECRILAHLTGIENRRINRGFLRSDEVERVRSKRDIVASLPLTIDDGGPFSSDQVRRRVVAHCMRHPCDLVIIDHLGHVADKGKSEYEVMTNATKTFGFLPKETNKPVLLVCQLNRELEKRTQKEPVLSDLRSTGEIEQEARMVLFVHRPFVYDDKADPNELNVICAKSNHSQIGKVKLWIDPSTIQIKDNSRTMSSEY